MKISNTQIRTRKKEKRKRTNKKRIAGPKIGRHKISRKAIVRRGRRLRLKIARDLRITEVEIWSC